MPQFESDFEKNLYAQRRQKLREIAAIGQRLGLSEAESLYPNRFPSADEPLTLAQIPDILHQFDSPSSPVSTDQLEASHPEFAVAGRLMSHRLQGKAGFAHLQQGGKRLQIYIRKDDVGRTAEESEDVFALYKLLDLGDHIGIRGTLMRTRTGELTLKALPLHGKPAISFLAKAMLALPDKYHGLEDVELRYRQRYVDLIMNSGTLARQEASTGVPLSTGGAIAGQGRVAPITTSSSRPEARSAEAEAERPAPPASNQQPVILSTTPERREGVESKDPRILPIAPPTPQEPEPPRNVREVFVKRAAILRAIRRFFDTRGYLEVETPMMQTIAGGAAARPFKTYHNALDIPLSLRIAPELYLKRLVVGGLDRVYEINRNFRNEGVSTQHNPEFTMLEFYQAYTNYHDLMDLTQELITFVAMEVNGTTIANFNGVEIDLGKWQKLSMREAIVKFWPPERADVRPSIETFDSVETFKAWATKIDPEGENAPFGPPAELEDDDDIDSAQHPDEISQEDLDYLVSHAAHVITTVGLQYRTLVIGQQSLGKAIANIFEIVAEPHLIDPTIIYDFPLAVSPLSKIKPDEPDWVERFEFYIGGFELGNAFSELNDPEDQRRRFEAQLEDRKRGDEEAMAEVDEDYVRALGIGLPPTAGEGIGIDRLTMILTGARSIRDVILFPLLRPLTKTAEAATESDAHTHGEPAE